MERNLMVNPNNTMIKIKNKLDEAMRIQDDGLAMLTFIV